MAKKVYDLIILGTGPAGMAAAIYAGRYGMRTLIVGNVIGGTANLAGEIENYPGFNGSGIDLMKKFEEQAKSFGAKFEMGSVDKIEKAGGEFCVSVDDKKFFGRSVISGLGLERRKLEIPGEAEFLGKGVSYCATCDGNFFKGKIVVVIGGSDSAVKAAIYLADICEKVYISYRKEKMRCEPISLKKIEATENIEIIYNSKPVEIIGDMKVSGLRIQNSETENQNSELRTKNSDTLTDIREKQVGADRLRIQKSETNERVLEVDGIFIEIGSVPVTELFDKLGVELENDYIKVDKEGRTSVGGFFAAGDGTNNPFKQVITATADGVLAARAVYEWVKLKK